MAGSRLSGSEPGLFSFGSATPNTTPCDFHTTIVTSNTSTQNKPDKISTRSKMEEKLLFNKTASKINLVAIHKGLPIVSGLWIPDELIEERPEMSIPYQDRLISPRK